ncbi:MAG: sugar phosphate isomerase/epimerase family protein [Rhodothermales bacterium]
MMTRRDFVRRSAGAVIGASVFPLACGGQTSTGTSAAAGAAAQDPIFRISLAEWSLHKALYAGELTNLDFPRVARADYGIDAIEYVNGFFKDKARDTAYLTELKSICEGEGVTSVLIMCDGEGRLGDPDDLARTTAVENHYRWVEAAKFLGCHSIRVNAASEGDYATQQALAADGLRRLATFGAEHQIGVIVENHGGLSSNGAWLAGVMEQVDHPNCGTLPDFGNFRIAEGEWYDIYQGTEELMPYAKAVSAKSHDFDDAGNERDKDYERLMRIVLDAGYRSYVGIEYEGTERPEPEGIRLTKALLERIRETLTPEYT